MAHVYFNIVFILSNLMVYSCLFFRFVHCGIGGLYKLVKIIPFMICATPMLTVIGTISLKVF